MSTPVEGKVAKILDDQTLVLNVGTAHGVVQGMVFCIYAPVEEVKDPDTGQSLGSWEMVKGYVQASHPQDRLTVCHAYVRRRRSETSPEERGTHTLSGELVEVSRIGGGPLAQARLNVDRTRLSGMPEVGPITVGDRARSVEEKDMGTEQP